MQTYLFLKVLLLCVNITCCSYKGIYSSGKTAVRWAVTGGAARTNL